MSTSMSKAELIEAAYEVTGGNLNDLSLDRVYRLITVSQYVTDLCLNEIERRGALTFHGNVPVVPYVADHLVETILTRPNPFSR
jgi:hypothetical protein